MIKKIIFSLLAVILTVGLVTSLGVDTSAQGLVPDSKTLCGGRDCPIGNASSVDASREGIVGIIINIATFLTFIAGAIAVLYLVYGGLLFITDDGSGSNAGKGKAIVTTSLLGLVIAIAAYFLVGLVSNIVSSNNLLGNIGGTGGTTPR